MNKYVYKIIYIYLGVYEYIAAFGRLGKNTIKLIFPRS
jgi:hypothetical protein